MPKLVLPLRLALSTEVYKTSEFTAYYHGRMKMALIRGIEPRPKDRQSSELAVILYEH